MRFLVSVMVIFLGLFISSSQVAVAQQKFTTGPSGLQLPRFVSLNADKVYMRTGPGQEYPIEWIYKRAGLPMKITDEYGNWRKVTDPDGVTGWMHVRLLSGRRTVLVRGEAQTLYKDDDSSSRQLVIAEPGVTGRLVSCRPAWCELEIAGREGWMRRHALFGIFEGEVLGK